MSRIVPQMHSPTWLPVDGREDILCVLYVVVYCTLYEVQLVPTAGIPGCKYFIPAGYTYWTADAVAASSIKQLGIVRLVRVSTPRFGQIYVLNM